MGSTYTHHKIISSYTCYGNILDKSNLTGKLTDINIDRDFLYTY